MITCHLSKNTSQGWETISKAASYSEAETFAAENKTIPYSVKMIDGKEIGYFTNCQDTYNHYKGNGATCFLTSHD